VGPVDDASDTTLYWSPPIRRHRPLSRILMAYHALANVMLLYDGVRRQPQADVEDSFYVRANLPDLRAAVQALDEPLRDNPALTALGRGLYQPLADRLDTLDH
jgi:HEXXH motif-containing protein